jgi:hypothetical protein
MFYCEAEAPSTDEKEKPSQEDSETDLEIEGEHEHLGVRGLAGSHGSWRKLVPPNQPPFRGNAAEAVLQFCIMSSSQLAGDDNHHCAMPAS